VLDRPVLAGRIEALEHDQHRALAVCVEPVLQRGEALDVGGAPDTGLRFAESCVICGIAVRQAEAALLNPKSPLEVQRWDIAVVRPERVLERLAAATRMPNAVRPAGVFRRSNLERSCGGR